MSLPASLGTLLPDDELRSHRAPTSVALAADSWPGAVEEIRRRFPQLADRLFGESEDSTDGFVLVVNGEVAGEGRPRAGLKSGDEIFFLPQIAGGR